MPTATDQRLTRARKEHQCCLCQELILVGTEYVNQRITAWESEQGGGDPIFWTYKAHPTCDEYWRLKCCDWCEGDVGAIAGGEFQQYLAEWQKAIEERERLGGDGGCPRSRLTPYSLTCDWQKP